MILHFAYFAFSARLACRALNSGNSNTRPRLLVFRIKCSFADHHAARLSRQHRTLACHSRSNNRLKTHRSVTLLMAERLPEVLPYQCPRARCSDSRARCPTRSLRPNATPLNTGKASVQEVAKHSIRTVSMWRTRTKERWCIRGTSVRNVTSVHEARLTDYTYTYRSKYNVMGAPKIEQLLASSEWHILASAAL